MKMSGALLKLLIDNCSLLSFQIEFVYVLKFLNSTKRFEVNISDEIVKMT